MIKKIVVILVSVVTIILILPALFMDTTKVEETPDIAESQPRRENIPSSSSEKQETEVVITEPQPQVEYVPKPAAAYKDKKFEISEQPIEETDGYFKYITGTIKNISNKEMAYAQITITLYDENGAQVGTAMDNIAKLEASGSWKFKAMAIEDFASWKIAEVAGF